MDPDEQISRARYTTDISPFETPEITTRTTTTLGVPSTIYEQQHERPAAVRAGSSFVRAVRPLA